MNDDTPKLPSVIAQENKKKIIELFRTLIKGKKSNTIKSNIRHDGKDGHWLEKSMGLALNGSNSPDILGYEMKNHTLSKTTFGDWSGDYRIFSKRSGGEITQDDFLQIFGQPNAEYNGRFAWSGNICPNKVGVVTNGGQTLVVDESNNIAAIYNYSMDKRPDKDEIVPAKYRRDGLILARWSSGLMKQRVENKFNQNGWFKCLKNKDGVYTEIIFGAPITFDNWISFVRSGDVIFDSGMHQGNSRPYANWRASNSFWNKLVTERYE